MIPVSSSSKNKLISTVKEKCRVCYTCVRECPAKAIKIINGQAEIISERCIACGNCIKVCSQEAKYFHQNIEDIIATIHSNNKKAAIIAPSFPAEFMNIPASKLIGMIRKLGFDYVCEVGFGADIIAEKYKEILTNHPDKKLYISSDCPAIVAYIEYFYPELTSHLAPIISPMHAMAKIIQAKYNSDTKIIFIGPCIAKKQEPGIVNQIITFKELKRLFHIFNIKPDEITLSEFDPPLAYKGSIFPIERGLIQTIDIDNNFLKSNIIVADGRINFQSAIKEFDSNKIKNNHLELLCCEGCITGPGMSVQDDRYSKQSAIIDYVKNKISNFDINKWKEEINTYLKLDYSRQFSSNDQRYVRPKEDEIKLVLLNMGKETNKDFLDCGACGYATCEEHAIAIIQGLAETEMCLPHTIEKMHKYINDLALSNEKLASMQEALKHSEKLAHMGQLSAGIAHELNNPLGVVLMYANIILDDCESNSQLHEDMQLIAEQAQRCKNIVSSLLNFARKNHLNIENIDVREFTKKCINTLIIPENIKIFTEHSIHNSEIQLDQDQMIQAISNLLRNAIDAMPNGGVLKFTTKEDNNYVYFIINDNGEGIPEENMNKLYTPFFTTKTIGKGTGLGLPTTYGIIKMHKGSIDVESNAIKDKGTTGTTFTVKIPKLLNL